MEFPLAPSFYITHPLKNRIIPDKLKALQEAFRVLNTTGKIMIADQVLDEGLPCCPSDLVETWAK